MVALYSSRPIVRQSFKGVKRMTVPKQSMSLKEIVKRFVRREALPLSKEGLYETRFGDLEKMSTMDIFDQMEHAKWLAEQVAGFQKREKERVEKEKASEKEAYEASVLAKAKEMAKSASPARGPAEGLEGSSRT